MGAVAVIEVGWWWKWCLGYGDNNDGGGVCGDDDGGSNLGHELNNLIAKLKLRTISRQTDAPLL